MHTLKSRKIALIGPPSECPSSAGHCPLVVMIGNCQWLTQKQTSTINELSLHYFSVNQTKWRKYWTANGASSRLRWDVKDKVRMRGLQGDLERILMVNNPVLYPGTHTRSKHSMQWAKSQTGRIGRVHRQFRCLTICILNYFFLVI